MIEKISKVGAGLLLWGMIFGFIACILTKQYQLCMALALCGIYVELANQRLLKVSRNKIVREEVKKHLGS